MQNYPSEEFRADFLCVEQKGKKWYNQFDKLEFADLNLRGVYYGNNTKQSEFSTVYAG